MQAHTKRRANLLCPAGHDEHRQTQAPRRHGGRHHAALLVLLGVPMVDHRASPRRRHLLCPAGSGWTAVRACVRVCVHMCVVGCLVVQASNCPHGHGMSASIDQSVHSVLILFCRVCVVARVMHLNFGRACLCGRHSLLVRVRVRAGTPTLSVLL